MKGSPLYYKTLRRSMFDIFRGLRFALFSWTMGRPKPTEVGDTEIGFIAEVCGGGWRK